MKGCNYYATVGYPNVNNDKTEVIEIRNQTTSIISWGKKICCFCWEKNMSRIYFEKLQASYVWRKIGENRGELLFQISRNKRKALQHRFIIQNYWVCFLKTDMVI